MNNLFVYCEIEDGNVADVSLELLTKGRSLANELKCQLEAVVAGTDLKTLKSKSFLMVLTNYMFLTPKVCTLILHCPIPLYWSTYLRKNNLKFV